MKQAEASPYKAVAIRQEKQKELVIEQLKKTPIIQIVCEKAGIARATFYRWRRDDIVFADAVEHAIFMGVDLINDMAESQLLAGIRDQNMTAIIFWLKHRHRSYGTRVQLDANVNIERKLTPEEEEEIKRALALAKLIQTPQLYGGTNDDS
jgi:hypothetical protein